MQVASHAKGDAVRGRTFDRNWQHNWHCNKQPLFALPSYPKQNGNPRNLPPKISNAITDRYSAAPRPLPRKVSHFSSRLSAAFGRTSPLASLAVPWHSLACGRRRRQDGEARGPASRHKIQCERNYNAIVISLFTMLRHIGARFLATAKSVNVKITYCGG